MFAASIQSQNMRRRMFTAAFLVAIVPLLASLGALTVFSDTVPGGIRRACIVVLVVSVVVILAAGFKILYDVAMVVLATSNRIKYLAEGRYMPTHTKLAASTLLSAENEEDAASAGLDRIAHRLQESMEELQLLTGVSLLQASLATAREKERKTHVIRKRPDDTGGEACP